jgi:hypothetical protein
MAKKRGAPVKEEKRDVMVAIRMTAKEAEYLDKLAEAISKSLKGVPIDRSWVLRQIIEEGRPMVETRFLRKRGSE